MEQFFHLFQAVNAQMNLSSIRNPNEVEMKHFLDSLLLAHYGQIGQQKQLLDLGTGGGFPGIPIKIQHPMMHVSFLDSVKKKLAFVREACYKLHIDEVSFCDLRAEEAGRGLWRSSQDVVVARAVAYLPVLLEYAIPLLRVGGTLVAAKIDRDDEERRDSQKALRLLGAELTSVHRYSIPDAKESRQVLVIYKHRATDDRFPRAVGVPAKSPLK